MTLTAINAPVWLVADPGECDLASHYKQLACEMIQQAVKEARGRGDKARAARAWLARDGLGWFALLGIGLQPAAFRAWLENLQPLDPAPAWRAGLLAVLSLEVRGYGYFDPA